MDGAPGIFNDPRGSSTGSPYSEDFILYSAGFISDSAIIGDRVVIFATGTGATGAADGDGALAQEAGAAVLPVVLWFRPEDDPNRAYFLTPEYAGPAPGLVAGTLQVNFQVPDLPSGNYYLELHVGSSVTERRIELYSLPNQ
jgi:uncharacterized protein (TIGR03437 family)